MRRFFLLPFALVAFPISAGAQAIQVAPMETVQPFEEIDQTLLQIQALQSKLAKHDERLRVCEQRLATLEDQLTVLSQTLVLTCTEPTVSSNGLGVSEECAPYTCNGVDGRCRQFCATSDSCAPGFVCDVGAGKCVSPY